MKKGIIAIIVLILIIILLIIILPDTSNDYIKKGNLYISKIMAKNETFKPDDNGEFNDYIEIYNGYNYDINLYGYHLSDTEYVTDKWTFPEITIKAKEGLIVYASGYDTCNIEKKICHTNFKLSSEGETISLSDNAGNIISKFTYPNQYPDKEYGYKKGKYTFLDDLISEKTNSKVKNYKLEITEYMTHNTRTLYDEYGNYYGWIEIHNKGNTDYDIEGLYITDNSSNLKKYLIPKFTLKKDEYKIVYFAGSKVDYQGAYANFALSDDDKSIIISNGEVIIDEVNIVPLKDNISYGKTDDGWKYFVTATPGAKNNTQGFTTWGGNDGGS